MKKTYNTLFNSYWNPYITVAIAGLLSALYFYFTKTVWAVTGEFTRFGGHLLSLFGVSISEWHYYQLVSMEGTTFTRTDGWMIWGMFLGALATVLLGNNFKIRYPQQKRRYFQGFTGGVVAGFGARLALGCNLAALFTGIPQFSFHAWIFMFTTAIGTYIGVKIVQTKVWKGKANLRPKKLLKPHPQAVKVVKEERKQFIQPIVGGIVCIITLFLVLGLWLQGKVILAISALFGVAFGMLIERGQICFTSAFRDLWVSGRGIMAKALSIGMIISTIVTFVFLNQGMSPVLQVATPGTFIGGLLFGIGIVLAGGCETGWMYRAMEGQVHFWVVGIGNIAGATFLAYAWDHFGIYSFLIEGWRPINLLAQWGNMLALVATLILLISLFLFAHWWEKNFWFKRGIRR